MWIINRQLPVHPVEHSSAPTCFSCPWHPLTCPETKERCCSSTAQLWDSRAASEGTELHWQRKVGKVVQNLATPNLSKLVWLALLFLNLPFPQKCKLSDTGGIFWSLLFVWMISGLGGLNVLNKDARLVFMFMALKCSAQTIRKRVCVFNLSLGNGLQERQNLPDIEGLSL